MNFKSLDDLLVDILRLPHEDQKCELCGRVMPSIEHLVPIHILGKGAYPRLRYKGINIVFGCDMCHKEYDEDLNGNQKKQQEKIAKIKGHEDFFSLTSYLKNISLQLPMLKHQNVRENLMKIKAYLQSKK